LVRFDLTQDGLAGEGLRTTSPMTEAELDALIDKLVASNSL